MQHGYRLVNALLFSGICITFCFASPPGGSQVSLHRANAEAEEKLKAAYAAFEQGQYQQAINIAFSVWQRYGDVRACWYPKWVLRYLKKEHLPDPYDQMAVVSETIRSSFLYTKIRKSTFPSYLLAKAYAKLGDYEQVKRWVKQLGKLGYDEYQVMLLLPRKEEQPPPKNTWRPLNLRFRMEDYFVLVPLDEACKVLGLSHRLEISPKTKKVRYAFVGEKGKLYPGHVIARDIKGETDFLAYAPYEEGGVVWVPFYWLAKQAGIKGWEVRDGKIYVAPR